MSAIRTLLCESIDYAGLFPPAGLDMATAVANYAGYRAGPAAWALGRFVVPVSRLGEFEAAAERPLPENPTVQPWRLALLAGPDLAGDLERTAEFNRRHSQPGTPPVFADTIEVKASSVRGIEDIMRVMPADLQAYIEIPIDRDPGGLIDAIGGVGGGAKVRTGGVTRDAFPATADLVRFTHGCARTRVPFKATAGLHHPLRAEYRLTYAPGSASATMFGFLNVLLAAAFVRTGMDEAETALLLEESSASAFRIDERGIGWRDHLLDQKALQGSRQGGMTSFGSCSFTEPIGDLDALHLLDTRVHQG